MATFNAFHDDAIAGSGINKASYSLSGNLKWDPVPKLRIGIEYMYASRELISGTNGTFHRLQFAFKYLFGYHNAAADEKK